MGITPIHLYGKNTPSMSLQADAADIERLLVSTGGTQPVTVSVQSGEDFPLTFMRQIQRHPVTEEIIHVDFFQVPVAEVMRASVPINLTGESSAIRMLNGVLLQALNSIEVECLPLDIPQAIELDISELDDFEKTIYASAIRLSDSITIITDPGEMVARVNPPRVAVAEEISAGAPEEGKRTEPQE
jgi:large subunit ribosomal protein L25